MGYKAVYSRKCDRCAAHIDYLPDGQSPIPDEQRTPVLVIRHVKTGVDQTFYDMCKRCEDAVSNLMPKLLLERNFPAPAPEVDTEKNVFKGGQAGFESSASNVPISQADDIYLPSKGGEKLTVVPNPDLLSSKDDKTSGDANPTMKLLEDGAVPCRCKDKAGETAGQSVAAKSDWSELANS